MANLLSRPDVVDLCTTVAASGDVATILTEANTAYHTCVGEVVDELDVKFALYTRIWVEYRVPVLALAFEVGRQLLQVVLGERVADSIEVALSVLEVWCLITRDLIWGWRWPSHGRRSCDMLAYVIIVMEADPPRRLTRITWA